MYKLLLVVCGLACTAGAAAQERWNLQRIVEYAMQNNISGRQLDVQTRATALTLKQSRLSQYPNASFQANASFNSGSNQDPTSFSRITQSYLGSGFQLQSSADIFNFFSKRNTIAANEWELRAAQANADKYRYDIALQAANSYLQVLLSQEQAKVFAVQLDQTRAQLDQTRKMVTAGRLPELNATQLEAQLAMDSVNYLNALGNITQNNLALKKLMSLDAATPLLLDSVDAAGIPLEPIGNLQPEDVFAQAMQNMPQQRFNDYRLQAADYSTKAARGAMLPAFSVYGGLGTNFNNQSMHVTSITPITAPLGKVDVGGASYEVFPVVPYNTYGYAKTGYFTQLGDNFRQSLGLSINVPIFNGGVLRTAYDRAKLNTENLQLQKQNDDLNLKQDIYSAYNAASVATQKYNASIVSEQSNQKAFNFAQRRYDVGMLSTFELITAQNNLLRARLETVINHYDFVFKMKVLEFYKGAGLKL